MIQGGGLRHRPRRPEGTRGPGEGRAGAGGFGGQRSAGAAAPAAGDARALGARCHHGEPGPPPPPRAPVGVTWDGGCNLGAGLSDRGAPGAPAGAGARARRAGERAGAASAGRSRLGPCAPRRAPRRPMCPHLSASPGDSRPRQASCERASAPQVGGPASRPPSSLAARSLSLAPGLSPPFSPPFPVTHERISPPEPPPQAGSLRIAEPRLRGKKGVGCAGRALHRRDTWGGAREGGSGGPAGVAPSGGVATGLPVSREEGRDHPYPSLPDLWSAPLRRAHWMPTLGDPGAHAVGVPSRHGRREAIMKFYVFFSSTVNKIQRVSSLRNFRLCVKCV